MRARTHTHTHTHTLLLFIILISFSVITRYIDKGTVNFVYIFLY